MVGGINLHQLKGGSIGEVFDDPRLRPEYMNMLTTWHASPYTLAWVVRWVPKLIPLPFVSREGTEPKPA